jgi:hypothetical protein
MSARRRRRSRAAAHARRAGVSALLVVVVLGAAIAGVVAWLRSSNPTPPAPQACYASSGGARYRLDPDQAENAALIAAVGQHRGLPARAVTIALATSLQESKLRNLEGGDRDSVGLFQQRPSQGWGTAEQILDPVYSAGRFYDALVAVPNYQTLPITKAAQAVQRSGFPEAYAQHEPTARAFASALTGYSPSSLTCTLDRVDPPGTPTPAAAAAVVSRVRRDFGELPATVAAAAQQSGPAVVVGTAPLGPDSERVDWSVAQWGVAVADALGLEAVQVGTQRWDRGSGTWKAAAGDPVPAGHVRLELPAA